MSNPIIERTELDTYGSPMSVKGVINKTIMLLGVAVLAAFGFFILYATGTINAGMLRPAFIISVFGTFGLGIMFMFRPMLAKPLAIPYALLEGVCIGSASIMAMAISPSIPLTALCATAITSALMLALYRSGLIKVTEKMRSIVLSAVGAIVILYLVQWGFIAFGSSIPTLFDGGPIAIGFSLFVIVVLAFLLLVDFDSVERAAAAGVSEDMEWLLSVGILGTLVWMYIEFVRLLAALSSD